MGIDQQRRGGGNSAGHSDTDLFWMVILGAIALPSILLSSVVTWRDNATGWLLEHGILVAADTDPLMGIPGIEAGLDGRRIMLAVLVIAALIAYVVSWLRLRRERRIRNTLIGREQS